MHIFSTDYDFLGFHGLLEHSVKPIIHTRIKFAWEVWHIVRTVSSNVGEHPD